MPLQLVTGPTAEPISRTGAKAHLRLTTTDEDALVDGLVESARRMCENRTQNRLLAQRCKLVLDSFPGQADGGAESYVPWGQIHGIPPNAIVIPVGPVLQVVSITYLDSAGVTQTLAEGQANDYVVKLGGEGQITRITPPFGKIWPANLMPQMGAVEVTFDAGFAAPLTASSSADTISVPGWKTLALNDTLRVSNRDGALPAPLAKRTDYYVKTAPSANVYTLAASSGGSLIDLTDAGTGESFIGEIPQNLVSWMLLAIGTMYENRESISVDVRITQIELPADFREGLLDPHRIVLY